MFLIQRGISAISTHDDYCNNINYLKRRIREALQGIAIFTIDSSFLSLQQKMFPIINHDDKNEILSFIFNDNLSILECRKEDNRTIIFKTKPLRDNEDTIISHVCCGYKVVSFVINNNLFVLECKNEDGSTLIKITCYIKMTNTAKVTEITIILKSTSVAPKSNKPNTFSSKRKILNCFVETNLTYIFNKNGLEFYKFFGTSGEECIIFIGSGTNVKNKADISEFVLIYSFEFGFIFIPKNIIPKHDFGMIFSFIGNRGIVCVCCRSGEYVNPNQRGEHGEDDEYCLYNETISIFNINNGKHINNIILPTATHFYNKISLISILDKYLLVTRYSRRHGIIDKIEMIWVNILSFSVEDVVIINNKPLGDNLISFRFVVKENKDVKILLNKLVKYQTVDGSIVPAELSPGRITEKYMEVKDALMSTCLISYVGWQIHEDDY